MRIEPVTICLIICGANMNILFVIKMKILVLIKWSYRSPNHVDLLSLQTRVNFEYVIQSFKNVFLIQS